VREIVGFVMGAAAGAAGALFATSAEGRALIERLKQEARPEAEHAATEWEPVLREVARAVRLAARELETAGADLRARIGEIAAALPEEGPPPAVGDAAPAVDGREERSEAGGAAEPGVLAIPGGAVPASAAPEQVGDIMPAPDA
jgi:gas vesicle protein